MAGWLFLGEQSADGFIFQLGRSLGDGRIFRWEPLPGKTQVDEISRLRMALGERSRAVVAPVGSGILPVFGLEVITNRYWLGWETRNGSPWLQPGARSGESTWPRLERLLPLIRGYEAYHQAGLVVGYPDWRRIGLGPEGLFMPDPYFKGFLAVAPWELPPGLAACRPPEEFGAAKQSQAGDCFYLGVIIYQYLAGRLPFRLVKGWPTRALLQGERIPLGLYQPGLDPEIAAVVKALLDPDGTQRPSVSDVKRCWERMLAGAKAVQAVDWERERRTELREYRRQDRWRLVKQWAPWVAVVLVLQAGLVWWLTARPRGEMAPERSLERFYAAVGGLIREDAGVDPTLERDFMKARQERAELLREVLGRPLAEVRRIRAVRRVGQRVAAEVVLGWWERSGTGLRLRETKEQVVLAREGRSWRVVARRAIK